MTQEYKTLSELDVKPGDVVECMTSYRDTWTVGKQYTMTDRDLECNFTHPQESSISTFRIISRAADTPKPWRDMTQEYKTLSELDVQPGDVVECMTSYRDTWTVGKQYTMTDCGLECNFTQPQQSSISTFRIVSRAADTPKLWRDMTPEEKGALLLAHHEGKVIEFWNGVSWRIVYCGIPSWFEDDAYRIRPKPNRETVTVHWGKEWGFTLGHGPSSRDTHRITFDLIDGKPDCDSVKMEEM